MFTSQSNCVLSHVKFTLSGVHLVFMLFFCVQRKIFFSDLKSDESRSLFAEFVREWNGHQLHKVNTQKIGVKNEFQRRNIYRRNTTKEYRVLHWSMGNRLDMCGRFVTHHSLLSIRVESITRGRWMVPLSIHILALTLLT